MTEDLGGRAGEVTFTTDADDNPVPHWPKATQARNATFGNGCLEADITCGHCGTEHRTRFSLDPKQVEEEIRRIMSRNALRNPTQRI